jgi:hypothetical protein
MTTKNNVKDYALVAYCQHHGYNHERMPDGAFHIRASDAEFGRLCDEFRLHYKPILQKITRLRKDLQMCQSPGTRPPRR